MNEQQQAAAFSASDRVLCIAGPGSGKTTTLVEAVARRAREDGPQTILCITFTNAGAQEMKRRLKELPADKGGPITGLGYIGTLHSFLLRLLRRHHRLVGLPKDLAVVDDDAKEALVEQVMDEMGSKVSVKKVLPLLKLASLIDGAKGMSRGREELVAVEYHRRLRQNGLLDLDALLHYGEKLVKKFISTFIPGQGTALTANGERWPYVHLFVDEYQDSAAVDDRIYELMPCKTKFMVGDFDQSVFGFRGANPGNLLAMSEDPNWEKHLLETNYRCRSAVTEAAQRLIEHNAKRVPKRTVAYDHGPMGGHGSVGCIPFDTPIQELGSIADQIARCCDEQAYRHGHLNDAINAKTPEDVHRHTDAAFAGVRLIKHSEVAVLARTNRQAKEFADFLRAKGIPVALEERPPEPLDWRAAKLLVAALASPHSDMAWLALVEATEGKAAVAKLKVNAAMKMTSVREALRQGTFASPRWRNLDELPAMSTLLSHESRERLHDACRELSANGELELADLSAYLRSGERQQARKEGVYVGTAHSAKGREWDAVFVVGCEESSFPQAKQDTDPEEERRLMFVAMTRARHRLVLTWCKARPQSRGPNLPPGPLEPRQPSRFIQEAGL